MFRAVGNLQLHGRTLGLIVQFHKNIAGLGQHAIERQIILLFDAHLDLGLVAGEHDQIDIALGGRRRLFSRNQ